MPANAPFEFYLTEVKSGWLEARMVLSGTHHDLSVSSSFSEPLKDLFRSLCDLHRAINDDAAQAGHYEFEWTGEGWLYFWELKPNADGTVSGKVQFKGKREVGGKEYPVWEIDFTTDWRNLAEQVFTQASEMLWMYGFTGYHDRWKKDFPTGLMMRLGHLLHGQPSDTNDFSRELGYLAETR